MTHEKLLTLLQDRYPQHATSIAESREAKFVIYSLVEHCEEPFETDEEWMNASEWVFECEWDCGFEEWFDTIHTSNDNGTDESDVNEDDRSAPWE
jgi:hypothetical protein